MQNNKILRKVIENIEVSKNEEFNETVNDNDLIKLEKLIKKLLIKKVKKTKQPSKTLSLYERPEIDFHDDDWYEKIDVIAMEAIDNAYETNNFDYILVRCDYTERFDKGTHLGNEFNNQNMIWTETRTNPNCKEDINYITSTFKKYLYGTIVFKETCDLNDLMNINHCACFNYQNLMSIEIYKNSLILDFDTESG
jgi:hypothetical protein